MRLRALARQGKFCLYETGSSSGDGSCVPTGRYFFLQLWALYSFSSVAPIEIFSIVGIIFRALVKIKPNYFPI